MKLLRELTEEVEFITEAAEDGKKSYYVSGIVMQGGLKNGNGRIYPMESLRSAVDKYVLEYLDRNRALGELGHPDKPTFNYDRASHKFVSLTEDGNNIIGKAKVMTGLPMGQIVKGLMDENCILGMSSRGLGSIKEDRGNRIVQNDFTLITAGDIVHTPSAPQAFMENLVENVDWTFNGFDWVKQEKIQEQKKRVKKTFKKRMTNEEREALFLREWKRFFEE